MKCSNCGAELGKGELICQRCGARQKDENNGIKGGKRKTNFKAIVATITLVSIILTSIFLFVKTPRNAIAKDFTDNINFDNSKFTVRDENTIVLREVNEKMTFSLGSDEGFVDFSVVNELGERVDVSINKDKNERYIVGPKMVWDYNRTYTLSISGNTFFTDEALYQFNRIIYTIKRKDVASYRYNENIKNLVKNPNIEVEVGDIVIVKDDEDQSICRKVVNKNNDVIEYDIPDLTEVFEEMDLHTTVMPDLDTCFKDKKVQNEIMMNFVNSNVFDTFVMTAYANSVDEKSKLETYKLEDEGGLIKDVVNDKGSLIEGIQNNLEVKVAKKGIDNLGDIEVKFEPVANGKEYGFEISATTKDKKEKKDENYTNTTGAKNGITFIYLMSKPEMVVDLNWGKKSKNNARCNIYTEVKTTMEFKVSYDKFNKQEWELYKEKGLDFANDGAGGMQGKSEGYFRLFKLPFAIPCPGVIGYLEGSFIPEATFNCKFDYNYKFEQVQHAGLSLLSSGFEADQAKKIPDSVNSEHKVSAEGGMSLKFPFEFKAGICFGVIDGDDIPKTPIAIFNAIVSKIVDLAPAANVDLYFEVGGLIELKGKVDTTFRNHEPIMDSLKNNTDINVSLGIGLTYDCGVEGFIKILAHRLDAKLTAAEGKYYFVKYNFIDIEATKSEIQSAFPIEAKEGEEVTINGITFVVLEKDEDNALLITKNIVDCKKYNDLDELNKNSTANQWSDSSLRAYLNDDKGFLKNFERGGKYIISKDVEYAGSDKNGHKTKDKVFILSQNELENKYKEYISKTAQPEKKALDNKLEISDGNGKYWLRDNGDGMQWYIKYVDCDGQIKNQHADKEGIGIRPCMWIRHNVRAISDEYSLEKYNGIILTQPNPTNTPMWYSNK